MIDFNSYFDPLNQGIYSNKERWSLTQLGRSIDSHTQDNFPDLNIVDIAIFNVKEYEGSNNITDNNDCKVRDSLYQLHFDNAPKIVDLGNLILMPTRKESFKIIEAICIELFTRGIIPCIIGGGQDISYAVYKAYVGMKKIITFCCVDKSFDIGMEEDQLASFSFLGKIIGYTPNHLFHYSNIGYQSFYVSPMAIEMLESMNFDTYRLGYIRSNMNELEPIMRNTDFISFDISAIQYAYASANVYASPNGLAGEDACKIMRYAGISDKLTSVGIFEYNQNLDKDNQTAKLISQMIWYFLEGYIKRKNEINPNIKDCTKYTVAFEDEKNEIIFYKSNSSGRWWMGVPFQSDDNSPESNYFVACSYQDYEQANKGEVPERWIKTFKKLD
ncbi:MAG: arginase family protein [Bacteroidota bacterium]|nr:arginase family protein [Bacteroidota bacterium]